MHDNVRDLYSLPLAFSSFFCIIPSFSCVGKGKGRAYSEQVAAVTIPIVAPRQQTQQPRQQQQAAPRQRNAQQRTRVPPRKFAPLPMTYAQLFNHLCQINLIELRNWTVLDPLPTSRDPNARCVFHSGGVRHDIENY